MSSCETTSTPSIENGENQETAKIRDGPALLQVRREEERRRRKVDKGCRTKGPCSLNLARHQSFASGDTQEPVKPVKVELADITVSKQNGTKVIKGPGSIRGNQFIIEECTDCDIYVLDLTATITIDLCVNCRIFIGPCESSIFVRDCKDCTFSLACQQYRCVRCERCDTLLMCTTAPVVESSKGLRFGCWRAQYFDLKEQLDAANLNVYQNKWSEIYDFTPNKEAKDDSNWCAALAAIA